LVDARHDQHTIRPQRNHAFETRVEEPADRGKTRDLGQDPRRIVIDANQRIARTQA